MAALVLQSKVQHTTDRFAKSTQHLISHLSKSFAERKRAPSKIDDTELTEEENASRCEINFRRLLHKTLELVQTPERSIPNPRYPPLLARVKQYYKSLDLEFGLLIEYKHNTAQYESQLNVINEWITQNTQNGNAKEKKAIISDKMHHIKHEKKSNTNDNKNWRLRNRRRVMRFSEKLTKEYEEKALRSKKKKEENEVKLKQNELDEREALMKELQDMTTLLKKGVIDIRNTLKKDDAIVDNLNEETYGTLDKVTALNNRFSNYVEESSGMTCTMCLMMLVVMLTWIWGFAVIYFI
eukprot:140752_1